MLHPKKVALVTGASSDIGSSIVGALVACEYHVIAQVYSNKSSLDHLKSQPQLEIVQQDLSHSDQAKDLIRQVIEKHSKLDALIHTIGPLLHKNLGDLTPQEWQDQMHLNLNLAFYLMHHAKPHLIESKGHAIHFTFSGVEFLKTRLDSTSYCAAKAGLVILIKSFATLLAPFGVRVNAISPGLIETHQATEETRKELAESIPLGRPGTPSEVSDVLLWLLTKSPQYVTGSQVPVAGGWEYI